MGSSIRACAPHPNGAIRMCAHTWHAVFYLILKVISCGKLKAACPRLLVGGAQVAMHDRAMASKQVADLRAEVENKRRRL